MSGIKVSHYKIRISDPGRRPRQPFSAVVLADVHNTWFGEKNEDLLNEIRKVQPKMVLAAGDMVTAKKWDMGADAATDLLGELTRRYPVYLVNGNHESRMAAETDIYGNIYEKFAAEIQSLGVHFLRNSVSFLEINRMKMAIYGYELPGKYYGKGKGCTMQASEIEKALGKPAEDAYHILLAHNPNYFPAYAKWGADLTLAGHLHGGMMRLPVLGGVIGPDLRLFPKYDHGLYAEKEKKMIVSAGLSSHTINMRINNPPELVVVDFL
ncbi:MAG: metallophosphoesterase [Lachnospiraceae bacterium]|nr:metallophosphoesterase [Lachnospiraceae bacterium]